MKYRIKYNYCGSGDMDFMTYKSNEFPTYSFFIEKSNGNFKRANALTTKHLHTSKEEIYKLLSLFYVIIETI